MLFKTIGKLDEKRKLFLMQHVADSKELVQQFWSTPMRVRFDKQRIAHVALMISPMDNKLHWVATLRLTRQNSIQVKPIELWTEDNFARAEKMLIEFYSEVGLDDGLEPKFEKFQNAYCYTKLLNDEEISQLPKLVEAHDSILESDIVM